MGVIVVVCATFGLAVSEARTEIMCLRTRGMPESTAMFSMEAAGQVYNQTNKFVYLGGDVNHKSICRTRSTGAYATHGAASGSTPSCCTSDRALPSSLNSGCSETSHSRQCCAAASRGARAHATTIRYVESTPAC